MYNELEDIEADNLPPIRNYPGQRQHAVNKPRLKHKGKNARSEIDAMLVGMAEDKANFDFSYCASRHERQWIIDSLGGFYEQKWLDDVLRLLKGGKEAHVYQCLAHSSVTDLEHPYIAAKVYRPRRFRNLKNDFVYREGREHIDGDGTIIIDDRMLKAINKRTTFGQELMHTSWIEHEVKTMQILKAVGADVPTYFASGNNAILMTYIGDDEMPAPTLNTVDLEPLEAKTLFERVLHNIKLMLANDRVHGDLSAYNILYWEGEITLIDFPQAINPHSNTNAFRIFERDVLRVCEYFARQGIKSRPHKLAADLWKANGHRLGPQVHPALLNDEDEGDRAYWEQINQT